jgi:outer membrane protein, heavy metal efflux system
MHRIIAAAMAATLCAQAAAAQSGPSAGAERLTLPQALELAGAGAPAIEAAEAGVRAAAAQRRVAGLRPNPTAGLEAENVAGTGQYSGIASVEATASLSLPIELGGKRSARVGVAEAQTRRANLAAITAQADLALRVTQAFNELSAAELRASVVREQAGFAEEGLRAARVRVRAGRASPLEEQRAEVARVNAATAAERADRAARLARANLARLIGRDPGTIDTTWFDRLGGRIGPKLAPSADGSLALAAAEADASIADAQVRLAQSQRIGDLTVSAGARRLEATNDIAAVVGVSIPLPLFNNGRAAIDAARAQRDQAAATAKVARLDAEQAIAGAENEVLDAEANARNASGPALAAAQEAARIARIGYREGKFGQLDLLEAERTLSETRTAIIDALTAYHDAQARLTRLTARAPITEDQP